MNGKRSKFATKRGFSLFFQAIGTIGMLFAHSFPEPEKARMAGGEKKAEGSSSFLLCTNTFVH
jgi:hypothetical protein